MNCLVYCCIHKLFKFFVSLVLILSKSNYNFAIQSIAQAIREEPRNPDPYKQVSDIYREVDKLHECLQYGLLAAHLSSRTTAAEWSELGDLACKLGRNEEAAACYGRGM